MHILVIGGAGYIGSHVVKELLQQGVRVSVFDNMSTGQSENLFPEAEFIQGDILDIPALEKAMQGVDGVVHLAAKKAVGESMEKPELYAVNNITGTLNILNTMAKCG
ncbi:MAG: NAD-dependent epimerase/dehydratase family protein, partial [Alphaproteobacteria bacterium]|nr:NAD-dependent epimerase/dehydratase family protein [Alphaproteobacteria bacterium]